MTLDQFRAITQSLDGGIPIYVGSDGMYSHVFRAIRCDIVEYSGGYKAIVIAPKFLEVRKP